VNRLAFALTGILAVLMYACSADPPNAIGLKLIPAKDALHYDSLVAPPISDSIYRERSVDDGLNTLLGITQSGTTQPDTAYAMFQFNTLIVPLQPTDTMISRNITLRIRSRFPDSTGTFGFTVHNTRYSWNSTTVTWDTLPILQTSDTVLATVDTTIAGSDTMITIPIDTGTVHDWNLATLAAIILEPLPGTTMILGFDNINTGFLPQYNVTYRHAGDTTTLSFNSPAYGRTSVVNGPLPVGPPDLIYCQGGIAYRLKLKFDVSKLPANASVIDATLDLFTDPSLTIPMVYSTDSVVAHEALNDSVPPTPSGLLAYGKPVTPTSNEYTFQLNVLTQQWIARKFNYGLIIHDANENSAMDLFAFHGVTAADTTQRPRLRIRYTILP
jgi:hypothetical protein